MDLIVDLVLRTLSLGPTPPVLSATVTGTLSFVRRGVPYRFPSGLGILIGLNSWTNPGATLLASAIPVRPAADGTPYSYTLSLNTAPLIALFTAGVTEYPCSIEVQWENSVGSGTYVKTARKKLVVDATAIPDGSVAPVPLSAANDFFVTSGSALTVDVNGGNLAGSIVAAQDGVVITNATNYVELNGSGVAVVNTTGWTTGYYPLAVVVASAGSITSNSDRRAWLNGGNAASGTVTHTTGALTLDSLVIGNGTDDIKVTTTGAGALTALGITVNTLGGVLTTIPTGKTLWVDSVNGSDANAGTFRYSFLTPNAADTAAASGDTVCIRPGAFTISGSALGKDGVKYNFQAGATLTSSATSLAVFSDAGSAITASIAGDGVLARLSDSNFSRGAVELRHASSVADIHCRRITAATTTVNKGAQAIYQPAGTLTVHATESIVATDSYGGGGGATAIYWDNGPGRIHSPYIGSTHICLLSVVTETPTGELFIEADIIEGTGNTATNYAVICENSTDTTAYTGVTAKIIRSGGAAVAAIREGSVLAGAGGRLYVNGVQKIYGRIQADSAGSGLLYVQSEKQSAIGNGSPSVPGLLYLTSGTNRLDIEHYDPVTFTDEMIYITGGTNYINGGDYVANSSSKGIIVTGGTTFIRDMVIDTSANSGTNGVTVSGGTVYLINCKIAAHASGKDIAQSGGTVTVTGGSGSGTLGAFTTSGTVGYTKAPTALLADTVTTNANLTGHVTSTGNAAVLGSFTFAQLNTAVSDGNVASAGANSDITSLSGVTAITGGASNMTILSGTGNSRTLTIQTTTSGGVATNAVTIGNDQIPVMSQNALGGAAGGTLNFGGAGGVHYFNGTITTSSGGMRLGRGTSSRLGFAANWFTGSDDVSLSSPSAGVIAVNTSTYDNALGSLLLAAITMTGALTITDANIVLGTTTGTKFGTATTQKLSFWNATPIVQPTTGVAAATFVANTSLIANDTATFDGYSIGQVVKALRNAGLLA